MPNAQAYLIKHKADICHPSTDSSRQGILLKQLQEMQDAEHERMAETFIQLERLKEAWKTMGKQEKAKKFDSDKNPRNVESPVQKVRGKLGRHGAGFGDNWKRWERNLSGK
ncbi:hypothetical protein [Microcoleus sp. F4-D5]|uniref:hypothetical protein n=1 Tax=Microcoleus sp. F4-D5 TaxID=2818760 RepID=UPI002FD172AF